MNRFHQRFCQSEGWAKTVEERLLPWALREVDLGERALEVGPGFGVTTEVLKRTIPDLTALELDPALAARLRDRAYDSVSVVQGDGTAMPFADGDFSGAACFTMLHHVQSAELQDRLFAEVNRVLVPGGVFAGSDSRTSLRFRMIHLFDTMVVVDPETLGGRLEAAGFTDVQVGTTETAVRFAARKPG